MLEVIEQLIVADNGLVKHVARDGGADGHAQHGGRSGAAGNAGPFHSAIDRRLDYRVSHADAGRKFDGHAGDSGVDVDRNGVVLQMEAIGVDHTTQV